jgi:hypothetical protein
LAVFHIEYKANGLLNFSDGAFLFLAKPKGVQLMEHLFCSRRTMDPFAPTARALAPEPKPDKHIDRNKFTIIACFPMCEKCEQLDKKIGHYQKLLFGVTDQLTVDRIKSLIADLHAQKVVLHPEQKQ